MDSRLIENAGARLHSDPSLIARGLNVMTNAWRSTRQATSEVNPDPTAVAAIDLAYNQARGKVIELRHCGEALLALESALPAFKARDLEAQKALADHRARIRQEADARMATMRAGGPGRPGLCPKLAAATPVLISAIQTALISASGAHDDPAALDAALTSAESAIEAFRKAVNAERREARLRASAIEAERAVNAALNLAA